MVQMVETKSGVLTLRGILQTPEKLEGKHPVVCLFHGYTSYRNESHFLFTYLARRLAERGIASVRFDFGGSGDSDGEFQDMTVLRELADAKAVLSFAASLPFADPERLGVVGMSMGGAVASMLAGDEKAAVRALCLWAPAANIGEIYLTSRMVAIRNEAERYVDIGGLRLGYAFEEEVRGLDILARAKPYPGPVLLVHGTADPLVPIAVSSRYLEIYGTRARLVPVEGANHTFDRVDFTEQVFRETTKFFTEHLA